MIGNDCIGHALLWLYQLADKWQTLLAALIALAAAWWAGRIAVGQLQAANDQIALARLQMTAQREDIDRQIGVAREQIASTQAQADHDRKGRLRAVRASLPTTLSLVSEYAQEAAKVLNGSWPEGSNAPGVRPYQRFRVQAEIPKFPVAAMSVLERIVELTDVEPIAERIESILREVQVLSSRTRPLVSGDDIELKWLASHVLQAAAIYARTETLFSYARRRSEGLHAADLWERVDAALRVMNIQTEAVHNLAREQREKGLLPGEADAEEPE